MFLILNSLRPGRLAYLVGYNKTQSMNRWMNCFAENKIENAVKNVYSKHQKWKIRFMSSENRIDKRVTKSWEKIFQRKIVFSSTLKQTVQGSIRLESTPSSLLKYSMTHIVWHLPSNHMKYIHAIRNIVRWYASRNVRPPYCPSMSYLIKHFIAVCSINIKSNKFSRFI